MRLQRAQPDVEACTLIRLSQLCYRSPQMLVQEEGLYRAKQPTASVTNTFRTAWAPSSRKSTPPRKPSPQKRAWQSIESAPHVGRRGLRRLLLHSCNRSDSPQRDGFPGCASAVELHCDNPLRGGRECMLKTNYTRRASARKWVVHVCQHYLTRKLLQPQGLDSCARQAMLVSLPALLEM